MKTTQQVFNGNNLELLKQYPDNYFDAIVTDPPYGLGKEPNAEQMLQAWITDGYLEVKGSGFMGKEWDAFVPQPIFWKEVFRTLKYGGHIVSFFGTRTYDWGVMAMRLAGFEVRDCIQWVYGSGFPKSHNISKAINKMYGVEFDEIPASGVGFMKLDSEDWNITKNQLIQKGDSIEEAKEWDGWGSALKPANEPIVLARKPLEKGLSIAENVLKWGTGGINIDGCRVGSENRTYKGMSQNIPDGAGTFRDDNWQPKDIEVNVNGRFPANWIMTHHPDCVCVGTKKVKSDAHHTHKYNNKKTLYDGSWKDGEDMGNKFADENGEETIENWNCHEDCPIRIMDEQSGILKSGDMNGEYFGFGNQGIYGKAGKRTAISYGDKGGASRFFYCAKASKKERNKGLVGFENKPPMYESHRPNYENTKGIETPYAGAGRTGNENKNNHPTVKPISLMRYLVRLITPPNGIVLDPFNGSGTTGIACKLEGMNYVGMELDAEYCKIAQTRIDSFTDSDLEYEVDEPIQQQELKTNCSNEISKNQLNLF